MKKIVTIFTAVLITASQTLFANDKTLPPVQVTSSFEARFGNSINVKWEVIEGIYVGTFNRQDKTFKAYYSGNGEFLASARYIPEPWLPQLIGNTVSTRFPGYTITEILEVSSETVGTSYFLHMENNQMEFLIRADSNGKIETSGKTKKDA